MSSAHQPDDAPSGLIARNLTRAGSLPPGADARLQNDPPDAVARTIGLVEAVWHESVKYPFQGTITTTDGERMWVFRYSSAGESRSLSFTGHVPTLRKLYPERDVLFEVSDDARPAVSEPIGDPPGASNEVPESSYGEVGRGDDRLARSHPVDFADAARTALPHNHARSDAWHSG